MKNKFIRKIVEEIYSKVNQVSQVHDEMVLFYFLFLILSVCIELAMIFQANLLHVQLESYFNMKKCNFLSVLFSLKIFFILKNNFKVESVKQ